MLYPVIPNCSWAATTQLNLNFTAAIKAGTLVARAEIIVITRRTAVARIDVHVNDTLVGAAQGIVTVTAPR